MQAAKVQNSAPPHGTVLHRNALRLDFYDLRKKSGLNGMLRILSVEDFEDELFEQGTVIGRNIVHTLGFQVGFA